MDKLVLVLLWFSGIVACGGILCLPLAGSRAIVHHDFRLLWVAGACFGAVCLTLFGMIIIMASQYQF